jgi:opacity protein-like surface antigen
MTARSTITLSVAAFAAALAFAAPAKAADMSLRGSMPTAEASGPNWGGVYIGGFYGYSSGSFNPSSVITAHTAAHVGLIPGAGYLPLGPTPGGPANRGAFGLFAGYQAQFEDAVVGVEMDYTRLGMDRFGNYQAPDGSQVVGVPSQAGPADTYNFTDQRLQTRLRVTDYMTLRLRAGWDLGYFLPFLTAGVVVGRGAENGVYTANTCSTGGCGAVTPVRYEYHKSVTSAGLAYGAGVDMRLAQYFLLRAEYQGVTFARFGSGNVTVHTVRAGVGIKY